MNSTTFQSSNGFGLWLNLGVAWAAKRHEVFKTIGLPDRVGDDVVNVQVLAHPVKFGFVLAASLACISIPFSGKAGLQFPIGPTPIVLGCSAFPLRAFLTRKCAIAGLHIAMVAAKLSGVTCRIGKLNPARFAFCLCSSGPRPPAIMVASHCAEFSAIRPMLVSHKISTAPHPPTNNKKRG